MDPKETHYMIIQAINEGELVTAYEYAGYLLDWFLNGGFVPEGLEPIEKIEVRLWESTRGFSRLNTRINRINGFLSGKYVV